MSIQTVTIKGFKTFAKTVKLKLSERLTAVVGPNGSGKSNLVDAIRWGIGEKTLNLLRVNKPSDIIFAGIGDRKPLSMAEVSIQLDNKNNAYPSDENELEIKRRIYRNGETEFEINGNNCRLKDIGDLFRGTGLGKQTYSVVGQGEVDLVLSATPGERLRTMEELAGVDILRNTKRSVERKLEKANVEMGRINASINEQKHNYERLRIQSEILNKYKSISDRATHLKLQLLLIGIREIEHELESFMSRYRVINIKQKESEDELSSLESDSSMKSKIVDLDKKKETVHREREEALVIKTRRSSELEHKRERLESISDEIQKAILAVESGKKEAISKENLIRKLTEQVEVEREEVEKTKVELSKIEAPDTNEKDENRKRGELTRELDKQKQSTNKIRSKLATCESELTVLRERLRQTGKTIEQLQNIKEEEPEENNLEEQLQNIESEIADLKSKQTKTQSKKDDISNQLAGLKAEIKTGRKELEQKKAQLDGLKFLPSKIGKQILAKSLDLSSFSTDEKTLIKNKLDWIIAEDDAQEIMENIPSNSGATIVLGVPSFNMTPDIKTALEGKESIQLTKNGHLIIEGKYIFQTEGKVSETSISQDIKNISAIITNLEKETRKLGTEFAEINSILNNLNSEISEKTKEQSRLQREQTQIITRREELEHRKIKRVEDLEKLQKEIEQFRNSETGKTEELQELQKNLGEAISLVRDTGNKLAEFDQERLTREKSRAEFERKIATVGRAVDQAENALKETIQNLEREKTAHKSLKKSVTEFDEGSKKLETESKTISEEIIVSERELNTANMTVVRTERLEKEFASEREELQESEFERENKIKTVRSRLGRYGSEKHKIELQQVELRTKRDRQVSDISEMGGSPDGYIEDTDVDAMRVELSDKSRQLAEYGAVNMRAVEEAETARERLNFIEGQLNDLAQTDANLRASLAELETKIRENFERVYQTIEKEFRRLADVLFPCAVGNLKRIRDENTETIGVQVEFMLPGRRMKNLHGLSGGEKTLGALALLFAFFRTKSSPFCVLDEVDAALDDNNVERFTKLLRTEAKDTQFVVITHNKETMRWCDTLYGITLDSSGTSMVVGVKLDEKDKEKKLDSVS